MAPQPLREVTNRVTMGMGSAALSARPELAAMVAQSIAIWAETECVLGTVLATMLNAHPEHVVSMFLSTDSLTARLAMIDNAAQECLVDRPAYLEMYQAARSVLKPLSLERHKLAHGTWAYSNDERLKDGLIWIDAKITVKTAAKRVLALRDMRSMLDKADSGELHFDAMLDSDRVPWEHLWFYSRGDLERLRRDMTTALDLAERLVEVVDPQSRLMPGPRHRPKMTAAEWQYHQLLSAPAIQEALRRLRRKQQKIPEELLWLPYGADPEDP